MYFSSPIRQKGTDQKFYSKIFRWTAAEGVKLAAEVRDPGTPGTCGPSQFYQLNRPQVSADGAVFGYTASRPVEINRYCSPAESNQGIIGQLGRTTRLDGNVALSPNGRYAITTTFVGLADDFHTVTDLSSGVSTIVAGAFNGSSRRVTNDGAILTPKPSAVILTDRTGLTRVLPARWTVNDAVIDAAGTKVVYVTYLGPNSTARLSVISVQTGNETELTTGFTILNPLITADASTLFFRDVADTRLQLFTVGIGGSNRRQITNERDGIAIAVVSGNGLVAFAVTSSSRLLRIDVASGVATELVSATPVITASYRVFRPQTTIAAVGSLIDLYGSRLASVRQLIFCGRPADLLPDLAQRYIRFQVLWDLPEGPCQVIVTSDSPFEHGIDLEVRQYDPRFLDYGTGVGLLYHSDFDSDISQANPARAGEVIVAYMTGLGPVDNNRLVSAGFQCRFDVTPVEVLYAGLAPQFLGFYQVNIRVPVLGSVDLAPSLSCGWDVTRQAATRVWLKN